MKTPPRPHPLDYDWRYDAATARMLVEMIGRDCEVLALGAPTVARLLDQNGSSVTLVDRQPEQGVRQHVVAAVEKFQSTKTFDAAIVDPPWYPAPLENWIRVAGRAVRPGGSILVSVWPETTRPNAVAELECCLARLTDWATVERQVGQLGYEIPEFEMTARSHDGGALSRSPLRGELIRLRVNRASKPMNDIATPDEWRRFTVDDYQLAVRLGRPTGGGGIVPVPSATGWHWPFVSARAEGLGDISIWSSEGEVGIVQDPAATISALREAFAAQTIPDFEQALAPVPELLTWRLPRPPYQRNLEWLHRQ